MRRNSSQWCAELLHYFCCFECTLWVYCAIRLCEGMFQTCFWVCSARQGVDSLTPCRFHAFSKHPNDQSMPQWASSTQWRDAGNTAQTFRWLEGREGTGTGISRTSGAYHAIGNDYLKYSWEFRLFEENPRVLSSVFALNFSGAVERGNSSILSGSSIPGPILSFKAGKTHGLPKIGKVLLRPSRISTDILSFLRCEVPMCVSVCGRRDSRIWNWAVYAAHNDQHNMFTHSKKVTPK